MKNTNISKKTTIIAILVLVIGIASFAILGLIISMGGPDPLRPATYPNGPGFQNAMTWFELAASKEEVFQILGDPGTAEGARMRLIMDKINLVDYFYMVSYPLFCILAACFLFNVNQKDPGSTAAKKRILYLSMAVSLAMLIGDAFENAQLLQLTKYAGPEDINNGVITALNIWTRVKWGAIFIFGLIMAFAYNAYFSEKKIPRAIFVLIYGSAGIIGLVSLSSMKLRHMVEPASYLVALSWLATIIHAGFALKSNAKPAATS